MIYSNPDFPLEVTFEEDGSVTFDWDGNHPRTSQLNSWTEEDFITGLQKAVDNETNLWEKFMSRTRYTVEEFEDHFDDLFKRVENGETLEIIREDGKIVVITPYPITFNE